MLHRPDRNDRHRRFRARRRAGVAVAAVEFDGEVINWLLKLGWLTEGEACSRDAVGRAIGAMIQDAARR